MKCIHKHVDNTDCERDATRIMATPMLDSRCVYVQPKCDEHAETARSLGAVPAAGPALSEEASKIEGTRGD